MTDSSNRSALRATAEDTTTYLADDRRATISRWMKGNPKLGPGVYSYSRLPGKTGGTCPGSSQECEEICYAKRIINKDVIDIYRTNTLTEHIPPLPSDAKLVRFHVSGDFDTPMYVLNWYALCLHYPGVRFWGYTRSWRVPVLLPLLTQLRDLPNVQLFASVDSSMHDLPDKSWRVSWIDDGDERINIPAHRNTASNKMTCYSRGNVSAYVCPEEMGLKPNCVSCNYCILGKHGDVIFLKH